MCNPPDQDKSVNREGKDMPSSKVVGITIEGITYDISSFKHPGGSIIKYLAGDGQSKVIDATIAFNEFHYRNQPKVERYLKSLPKITTTSAAEKSSKAEAYQALSVDFAQFRKELEEEGYFNPSYVHITYRLVELVVLFAGSFYLFYQAITVPSFFYIAALINGIAQGRCGWLMHEGGHYSLTGISRVDVILQEVVYGLGCGMSGGWWRNQHNKHHATPQKLKHDVDLETLPLVAFNEQVRSKVSPKSVLGKWLSFQAYLFAPVSCLLVGLFWTLFLHPRHILVRTKNWLEAACILFRYVGWAVLLTSFGLSPMRAFSAYLLSFAIGCIYIFLNFAVSHTHLPVTQPEEYLHWVEYAGLHTTNVSTKSWFIGWWMSYLNFQIEHHLFPSMPQFRHPRIAPRVKELFEKHGIVYDERPYLTAMRDTFANLNSVGNPRREKVG